VVKPGPSDLDDVVAEVEVPAAPAEDLLLDTATIDGADSMRAHEFCSTSNGAVSRRRSSPGAAGPRPRDDVSEIGPGPGFTTDVLRQRVAHLTAVEIDDVLASG